MSRRNLCLLSLITLSVIATGCGPGNENLAIGSLAGGAIGAGAGGVVGNQAGRSATGAAIGGTAGALIGGSIGATRDEAEKKTSEEDRFIERQKNEMRRQGQEVEDLRRQKYHDDYFHSRYPSPDSQSGRSDDDFGGH